MIGNLIFADIPLATAGTEDVLWGWDNQCPEKDIWGKVPANEDQWSAQIKADNVWSKKQPAPSNWRNQDKTQSSWSKIRPRVEDHKKC